MSTDDDSKKPGPEDDGWGDAPGAPEPKKAPVADPIQIEERVAAMRAKGTPESSQESDKPAPNSPSASKETPSPSATKKPATKEIPKPKQQPVSKPAPAPAQQQPTASVIVHSKELSPSGHAPQASSQVLPAQTVATPAGPARPAAAMASASALGGSPPPLGAASARDDAPQWKSGDAAAAPPSDMMAAAGVLADKANQPAAKKRRKREKRKQKDPKTQLTRRQQFFLVGGAALLVVAAVCAVLGWLNSKNYYLVCGPRSITAEQGSFWPYGRSSLPGEAFQPIVGDHPCTEKHFENRDDLEVAFLAALIDQATRLLSRGDAKQVATAEQELQQALLLSRSPERAEQRAMAERLQGDVSYWRGAAEVQAAVETLRTSADYFEEAAAKHPRHSNDSSAWAEHARFISEEIDKGPRSLRKDDSPKEEPHFQGLNASDGTAPSTAPVAGENPDALVDAPELPVDAGVDAAPPPRVDAALPTGGVLL